MILQIDYYCLLLFHTLGGNIPHHGHCSKACYGPKNGQFAICGFVILNHFLCVMCIHDRCISHNHRLKPLLIKSINISVFAEVMTYVPSPNIMFIVGLAIPPCNIPPHRYVFICKCLKILNIC